MLKKGNGKSNMKDEAMKEERKHEPQKHRKMEWWEKSNASKCGKTWMNGYLTK